MLKALLDEQVEKTVNTYKVKPRKMESVSSMKNQTYYPSLYLSSEDLPDIKDWEVKEEYFLLLKVKMKSKNAREDECSADFDIHEIVTGDVETVEDEDEDDKPKSDSKLNKAYGV